MAQSARFAVTWNTRSSVPPGARNPQVGRVVSAAMNERHPADRSPLQIMDLRRTGDLDSASPTRMAMAPSPKAAVPRTDSVSKRRLNPPNAAAAGLMDAAVGTPPPATWLWG